LPASRSVKGRAASVFVAWQRDAVVSHDAGLRTPTGITILESGWGTHAGNTGRRPKCRSGRQFARTGSVGSSDKPWDMQQAVKSIACGTQANTASVVGSAWKRVGPGPVCRLRSGVREPVCRLRKGIRALACKCGRRGRGYSPSRSAQPLGATDGIEKTTTKRQALRRIEVRERYGMSASTSLGRRRQKGSFLYDYSEHVCGKSC